MTVVDVGAGTYSHKLGWLFDTGDCTTQLYIYRDYDKPL